MKYVLWTIAIFGIIVIVGGLIGYVQAHSLISLLSGLFFGIALLGSAYAISKGYNRAHYIAVLLALLLTAFFHYRYVKTGVFFPSAFMAILSALVTVWLLISRPRRRQ